MRKDSIIGTLVVATVLCVLCSILVSASAVGLKDLQDKNKKLDIKKNLLLASGLLKNPGASASEIEETYSKVEAEVINLDTTQVASQFTPETFDQKKARKDPNLNKEIKNDLAGIKTRSEFSTVYKVKENGRVKMIILPINGKGLWSTLYGFIALAPDTTTVKGIGFYEHAETPGLGGEVDNPRWKAQWKGKKVYDQNFNVELKVVKGSVSPSDPNSEYKIDGLSGATITSNGVTGLVRYWLGEDGFGPYLEKFRRQNRYYSQAGI